MYSEECLTHCRYLPLYWKISAAITRLNPMVYKEQSHSARTWAYRTPLCVSVLEITNISSLN